VCVRLLFQRAGGHCDEREGGGGMRWGESVKMSERDWLLSTEAGAGGVALTEWQRDNAQHKTGCTRCANSSGVPDSASCVQCSRKTRERVCERRKERLCDALNVAVHRDAHSTQIVCGGEKLGGGVGCVDKRARSYEDQADWGSALHPPSAHTP
jgi:hypothetical protein